MDKWKSIWENRTINSELLKSENSKNIFLELKKCNGFDVIGDGLTYDSLYNQYLQIKRELSLNLKTNSFKNIDSVYEVGCGSGANLYLFELNQIECGGMDYSKKLINIASQVLNTDDLNCDEAINLSIDKKYDAVFSNSVFSYFPNEEYAIQVLEKMYQKAKYSIGVLDIHNIEKEAEFIEYRKKEIEDYEKKYEGLPKLFYSKKLFLEFAQAHNMEIKFAASDTKGYWNNNFVFHCYMYKQGEK